MRRWIRLGIALGLLAAAPAAGQSGAQTSQTISLDLTNAFLEDVLKLLSKESGMNFVASQAVRDQTITTYMNEVPIHAAIESLLEANRLTLKQRGGGNLYVVVPSSEPEVQTMTKVFPLKYARVLPTAGELFTSFGLSGSLIQQGLNTGGSGGSTSSSTIGGSAGGLGGGAGSEETGISNIISSLLTEHGSVVTDPRTNSLIVTDIPERFPVIEETIAKLDVRPKQIYIEAEVLEVTLDTLRRIGIEYGDSAGQLLTYSGFSRTTAFPFSQSLFTNASRTDTLGTFSGGDINALLKLLATESDVKFLARPRLMTLSGEVAEIQIVEDTSSGLVTTSQNDTGTITESVERSTVGTILRVTPIVNDDKYITMVIEPEVSRVVASSKFSNFLDPHRRAARTTVMIEDTQTAMIAGLISTEDTETTRRIPGLGDLPIIGIPFRRADAEREHTEVILFITPTIMREQAEVQADLSILQGRELAPLNDASTREVETLRRRAVKNRAIEETFELLGR